MVCICVVCIFFFFKQKTAYELRISDWSSDVCSSDLREIRLTLPRIAENQHPAIARRDAAGMDVDDFGSGPARKHGARLTGAEAGPQGDKLTLPVAKPWGGGSAKR